MKSEYCPEEVVSSELKTDQRQSLAAIQDKELVFTEIVNAYFPKLLSVALRITKSRQTAEDIVQEVFLKLWQRQAEVVYASLGPWLHKVVINDAYKHLKREFRQMQLFNFLKTDGRIIHTDVEEHLTSKETALFFDQAFRKLPERQQMVYQLSKKTGLSRDEIAQQLDISPNTVKVHLLRAVKFIKEHMAVASLFLIFSIFNYIIFSHSNTNFRPGDIDNEWHCIENKLSVEIISRRSNIQHIRDENK